MTAKGTHAAGQADIAVAGRSPAPLSVLLGLEGLALGGCPINALDLGRALRERGHRVNVFAIEEQVQVSLLPYAEKSGFEVELLPSAAGAMSRARQMRLVADRLDADVVHVFAPWLAPAAAVAVGSRRRGVAVVTNWMMSNVDYVPRRTPMIVGTRAMQQEAETWHRARVHLMEPPVDVRGELAGADGAAGFRSSRGIADTDLAAVIVGRVDSHMKAEGLRHAIGAVASLDRPELKLIIVGDGNAFDEIKRDADRANADLGRQAVIMTGAMYDPRPAYAAADVALGMGGSALRALAHGKPLIVLGENGFAREFGPDTLDYFLAHGYYGDDTNDSPVDHLGGLLGLLLDADRRNRLGAFGSEFVQERFALEHTAAALETIYRQELAADHGRVGRLTGATRILGRAVAHETRHRMRRPPAVSTPSPHAFQR